MLSTFVQRPKKARPVGDRGSLDQVAPALTFGVSGADDETRTRDPTVAIACRMSHASPPVSAVPLSCTFLALLSQASQQSLETTPFRW